MVDQHREYRVGFALHQLHGQLVQRLVGDVLVFRIERRVGFRIFGQKTESPEVLDAHPQRIEIPGAGLVSPEISAELGLLARGLVNPEIHREQAKGPQPGHRSVETELGELGRARETRLLQGTPRLPVPNELGIAGDDAAVFPEKGLDLGPLEPPRATRRQTTEPSRPIGHAALSRGGLDGERQRVLATDGAIMSGFLAINGKNRVR